MEASAPLKPGKEEAMGNMNLIAVGAALVLGCSSGESVDTGHRIQTAPAACDVSVVIPDDTPEGIRLGPVAALDGAKELGNIGLYLEITHPNAADVGVWLCYDENNDGVEEARAEVAFYRAKREGWAEREPSACPQGLSGRYYFGGDGSETSPFAVFRGLNAGGSFFLSVVDSLPAEMGIVHAWSIHQVQGEGVCAAQ
jgi:hypothetical protein